MITSKVTKRGQTTLPRQIRNALQIETGQSLVYEIRDGGVFIRSQPSLLNTFGALKGKGKPVADYKAAERDALEEHHAHVAQEGLK